jgi:VWFA-related protein
MARPLRTLGGAALVAFALAGSVGTAQQSTPPQTDQQGQTSPPPGDNPAQPIFRAGINYVRVDAIITDKAGNAVTDLKAADFTVTEDGKPQTIDTFKLVKLDGGVLPTPDGPPREIRNDSDEETEAARDDVRLFAIFLDDYHVRQLASMAVRTPLTSFIETQLGPSDMVSLMHPLDSVYSQRMTRDHSAIVRGVQQFLGRKFDYTPRNQIEEQYAHYPADQVEKIRNQISLSAIKGLIVHLGSLKEGRKALILVSEGYTNMLPPQLRDPVASMPASATRIDSIPRRA